MDKDNKHPFHGETVYFGTQHGKAEVLAPQFSKIGMRCETVPIDTDIFGTFTGEIERKYSVEETLRKKVDTVLKCKPESRFALASEGSFGPHSVTSLIQTDYEVLLFFDRLTGLEIFVKELSLQTNHEQIELQSHENPQSFLNRVNFPSHGIIVRPKDNSCVVFKGVNDYEKLRQAILTCFQTSKKVILSTDMRASFNPTRMRVINQAGEQLIERLTSFCPSCAKIGFGPIKTIRGLPCDECGLPTQVTKEILWSCSFCKVEQRRAREDGLSLASPADCDFCNP